jgi:hypothetical protein
VVCEDILLRKVIWMKEYGHNRMENIATRSFIQLLMMVEG